MHDAAQVTDLEGHGSGAASRGVRDGHSRLGPEGLPIPQPICVILALRLLPLPHQLQACSTVYSVSLSVIQLTLSPSLLHTTRLDQAAGATRWLS